MDKLIPTDEAAKEIGVSPRRIRAMVTAGQLTPVLTGKPYWFSATAIAKFAAKDRPPGRKPKPEKPLKKVGKK